MIQIILKIDGMMCGMCEVHVNDAVRKAFEVKKVSSSHSKGRTEIISENDIDEKQLTEIIAESGYTVISVTKTPYEKKGFFSGLFKK